MLLARIHVFPRICHWLLRKPTYSRKYMVRVIMRVCAYKIMGVSEMQNEI